MPRRRFLLKALRVIVGVSALVGGASIVLLAALVGHCSAFGGRCPSTSTFDADTFRIAASGAALAVGVPMWMARPTRRRFFIAAGVALTAGLVIGAIVMVSAAG